MRRYALVPAIWALTCPDFALAQRGSSDWMTTAYDVQRSAWVRSDAKISLENMRKPGFDLVWKIAMESAPRPATPLTPPALLDFYIGYHGFRTLGFFGAASDRVIAVDTDLGRTEWEKGFASSAPKTGTPECPGGMTSPVARPTSPAYPSPVAMRGFGRSSPAKSGVGLPNEGAVTLRTVAAASAAPPPRRVTPVKPTAGAEAFNPFAPRLQYVIALASDGKLHSLWLSNGNEADPPVPFLPPNAHAEGLMAFDNTAYVTTTNSCGGVDNGVWALNLATKQVTHWKSGAKSIAGTAGPAAGPDGTLYAAAGSELVALSPKKLETLAMYKTDGAEFTSSPVVFEFKERNLIAATTADGRLHLLDSAALASGKPLDRSEQFSGRDYKPGALASWQDSSGNRWILSPASAGGDAQRFESNGEVKNGAIAAWRVVEKNGAPALEPAWMSRDLVSPLPPIVVNGVVFAVAGGSPGSSSAVLYALDAASGKELWNSGSAMVSSASGGGLAAGGTRVYVATQDGIQYAFGFPIEH